MTTKRYRLGCLLLLVALAFSLGCTEFVPIGVLADIAKSFEVGLDQAGLSISLYAITYAILTPIITLSTGRFKRYQLLLGYLIVFIAANCLMVFAQNFGIFLLSRVILGSISGPLLALGITFIPELVGVERTSMAISVVYTAFSIAMVLITSVGKLLSETLGWRMTLLLALVFSVIVSALALMFLPKQGAVDEPAPFAEQVGLLREPVVLLGICIFVFGVGAIYVLYGYITPYLQDILGLDATTTSTVLMFYGVVALFSNLLSGICDSRFGLKALIVNFPLQAALLLLLFVVSTQQTLSLLAVGIIFLIALSMYVLSVPCISMFMVIARKRYPKALTLASAIEPAAFNVGIAFGTGVGGLVSASIGLGYEGLIGMVFSLIAGALSVITQRLAAKPYDARY